MWKAMMFSVRPVRTASAALRTKRETVSYQSGRKRMCVVCCLLQTMVHLLSKLRLKHSVTCCKHTFHQGLTSLMSNFQLNVNLS